LISILTNTTGVEQATNSSNRGGIVRRDPVTHIHPIIRTHPVTGEKAIFVNPQFTRRIIGYKKEESDFLQVPVRPYCQGPGLPGSREVGARNGGRVGQSCDGAFGDFGLA
jgi:hypothetical protein